MGVYVAGQHPGTSGHSLSFSGLLWESRAEPCALGPRPEGQGPLGLTCGHLGCPGCQAWSRARRCRLRAMDLPRVWASPGDRPCSQPAEAQGGSRESHRHARGSSARSHPAGAPQSLQTPVPAPGPGHGASVPRWSTVLPACHSGHHAPGRLGRVAVAGAAGPRCERAQSRGCTEASLAEASPTVPR